MENKSKFDADIFNAVNPIVGIKVFKRGSVEILRENRLQGEYPRGKRKEITVFSKMSRERLLMVAKETDTKFESFITLTYGANYPLCGKETKVHLQKFLRKMRVYFGGFRYLWFLEFQKRGAPHFHILSDLPPPTPKQRSVMSGVWVDDVQDLREWEYTRLRDRKQLSDRDACYWFHVRDRQWEGIREKDGVSRYCAKYALKMNQKIVPKEMRDVGRFWGADKYTRKLKGTTVKMSEAEVRRVVASRCPRVGEYDVIPKFIFDCFT